ncbi:hypothetical protein E8E12_009971 [Didymella heteroderae]|uniref:Uncharacterized protein n=1 Tax=Didymella heteroderae TaxID=1769908 RepID=A0A9P5C345_9PLEO|nr:hypothetical protein E8E12_009971 [Didymella heteroderae]
MATAFSPGVSTSSRCVIPDISSFARQVREARTDLNAINNDLQIIRTGLGVAQDDFSTFGSKLPTALVDAFTQILDSSDDTSERLHKSFLKLSCSTSPKDDWRALKDSTLIILRQDLEASRIVLDLAVDYLSLFGRTDTVDSLDSLIESYVSGLTDSDVSIIHKQITSDKIAVAKGNRKDLDIDSRIGVDRILANIPSEATSAEVERVLWEGANPMVAHPEYGYFFIRAAHDMSSDILRVLMEYGADITRTSSTRYYSAMHAAVMGGQLEILKSLTSLGHSIDATNNLGETPLHLAARTPGPTAREIARFLADKGADVNHEANDGHTPLKMALTAKKLTGIERSLMIELLLSYGAEGELNQDLEGRRSNSKGLRIMGIT